MKLHFWILGGALLAATPIRAQAAPEPATPGQTAGNFEAAQKTWHEALGQLKELDSLIAARKLEGVHDAALNLRDTVRELRFGWGALSEADKSKADDGIRKIDSLLDELHESADNNNPAAVAKEQRKLHVLLDQISSSFPSGTLKPVGPVTSTSSARDPYCRMMVDPATAAGSVVVGGQTYYFCSAKEAEAFKKNPAPYVALYDQLVFGKAKTFAVSTAVAGPIAAGPPAQIAFAVREQGGKSQVTKFQLVHEKLMHLIVVSDDLSWFAHEHPELGKDGRFYIRQTFPRDGRYFLYTDFTPADGVNQILRSEVRVGGGVARAPQRLSPDKMLSRTVDGVMVELKLSSPLRAGRQSLLTYSLSRAGQPVTDMSPYLGAMGHMMAVSQSGERVVHTHTVSSGTDPETGLVVSPSMSTASGPKQTFKLQLPTSGLYKAWAQFGVNGHIITVPFTFSVQENPNMKLTQSKLTRPIAAVAVAATMGAGAVNQSAPVSANDSHAAHHGGTAKPVNKKPSPAQGIQRITVTLPAGYKSGAATVKAGKPVAITFFLKEDAGCGNTISVPAAKWTKTLSAGQKATVTYTPKKSGTLDFQCGMGMYQGTIIVK